MLTQLTIRNFKRFDEVDFELDKAVVLIGPNDSGRTTALQALALWDRDRELLLHGECDLGLFPARPGR